MYDCTPAWPSPRHGEKIKSIYIQSQGTAPKKRKESVSDAESDPLTSPETMTECSHVNPPSTHDRTPVLVACRSGCRAPLLSGPQPSNNSIAVARSLQVPFWRRIFPFGASFSHERWWDVNVDVGDRLFPWARGWAISDRLLENQGK